MRNQGSINSATGSARRHTRRAALPAKAWPVLVKAGGQAIVALQVSAITLKKRDYIVGGRS